MLVYGRFYWLVGRTGDIVSLVPRPGTTQGLSDNSVNHNILVTASYIPSASLANGQIRGSVPAGCKRVVSLWSVVRSIASVRLHQQRNLSGRRSNILRYQGALSDHMGCCENQRVSPALNCCTHLRDSVFGQRLRVASGRPPSGRRHRAARTDAVSNSLTK